MKIRVLSFLLVACLLGLAAWLVNRQPAISGDDVPNPITAAEIPEKYRETVNNGLEYLLKSQFKDGHWEGDGGQHPVAMTGLAGLALLMEKDGQRGRGGRPAPEAKYSANIRKAADWLIAKCEASRDGLIFSEHPSETARYMQGHGLATIFLAGAYEDDLRDSARRAILRDVLIRAVKYIVKAQSTQGGWYNTSKVEGHDFDTISATVIQIQALQAAENKGIPVPSEAMVDAQEYLKMALAKAEKAAKSGHNHGRTADIAAALACRFRPRSDVSRGHGDKDEWCEKWFKYCRTEIPVGRDIKFGRDELLHYYYAQAVFSVGGDTWSDYRTAMFDHLQSSQNKDGSWPASDGMCVGQVYSTAVWCTVLQLDKRSHPSMERVVVNTR